MYISTPTWDEFAWAVFYFGVISEDITGKSDYLGLMCQTQLLQNLKTNPNILQASEIQQRVIKGFLNRWKCRVENSPATANSIQKTLQNLIPYLRTLNNLSIQIIQFNEPSRAYDMEMDQVIEHCYAQVRNIGHNFGPTATSKLLHVLQPALFVMWDKDILDCYRKVNRQIMDNGRGYLVYLQKMKSLANNIHRVFQNSLLTPPAEEGQDPADYLNARMEYNPPKTMAKYLDEYNWVTITCGLHVPPAWHP